MNTIQRVQEWYASQCNEDWEHSYGITIENIDNPGWIVKIDLTETNLYCVPFEEFQREQRDDELDWVSCKSDGVKFIGACGARNLEEVLIIFLNWAERVGRT
ncbi:immunity 53 family protein [Deefgea tanakiae]|uniref:Immunity 53 family protein n=1 Tax=Deefgea tanakiae TaxID=2865840 RepID=A0ABX8Z1Y2_9NEIS|nr:immunity 53 family protein [Deefgea tanakiae]QZA76587.1 immunity 53 family protein [Deefgea tanakiae]